MRIYIYSGGEHLVAKSGVGQAIRHQREMLRRAGVETTDRWSGDAWAIHINTVLPDILPAVLWARLTGRKVVCYGHSTMEDFRHSFRGSDALAPLFRRWITFCYGLGDVVLTPTEYSRHLLESYGLKRPVYAISNGVDTDFFAPDPALRDSFRRRRNLRDGEKAVVSVGHTIARKGLPEFADLARRMPDVRFIWYGWTDPRLVPAEIRQVMETAPENRGFPRLCGPGGAAGGLLRRRRFRLHEPRGDRGHRGTGGPGLRHPHGAAGHPGVRRLAGGREERL